MTHRIEIPDEFGGGWVEIREKRSWADVKRIDQQALRWEGDGSGQVIGKMDMLEQGIAKLEAAVVRWSLTDENGSSIPPDRGGFVHADFDPELGDWMIEQIDAYYAGRSRTKRAAAAVEAAAAAVAPQQ
ncbi:MAG: hypothetical protein WAY02_09380 [Burkholderiaceae bacterium]